MELRPLTFKYGLGIRFGLSVGGVLAWASACSSPSPGGGDVLDAASPPTGTVSAVSPSSSAYGSAATTGTAAGTAASASTPTSLPSATGQPLTPADDGGATSPGIVTLAAPPLTFAPTLHGFGVNVVLATGEPSALEVRVRARGDLEWRDLQPAVEVAPNVAEWQLGALAEGTRYEYQIVCPSSSPTAGSGADSGLVSMATDGGDAAGVTVQTPNDASLSGDADGSSLNEAGAMSEAGAVTEAGAMTPSETADAALGGNGELPGKVVLYEGSVVTQRPSGESFSFALISDSHIGYDLNFSNQGDPAVLREICSQIAQTDHDFVLNLGDVLDYHQFGFNLPPPSSEIAAGALRNYRSQLGDMAGNSAHFSTIGNWDGENGDFTAEEIARSREQRMLYLPNPRPTTYAEGGSDGEDYYAFTWGDALFVVLNVMSYTPTTHSQSSNEAADDWTLGAEQLAWLEQTLQGATAKWRFTFIHHTVGGKAGNDTNSAYGRGGGLAAYVGEQAVVHQMLLDYGVQIFFYGHDHQFMDMVVDGVHYTMPGVAGAPWPFTPAETGYPELPAEWSDAGWTQVDVTDENVRVRFQGIAGSLVNEFTVE